MFLIIKYLLSQSSMHGVLDLYTFDTKVDSLNITKVPAHMFVSLYSSSIDLLIYNYFSQFWLRNCLKFMVTRLNKSYCIEIINSKEISSC